MTRDPAVEALLADHTDPVIATAQRLRSVVLEAQPQFVERARPGWHSINYRDPAAGFVCAIFPIVDRVQLVFEWGVLLPDPDGLLLGSGRRVRHLGFRGAADVDPETVAEFLDAALDVGARARSR